MSKNPELDLAWDFIEKTDRSIFLTGKAGTGKTTFLHSLKSNSLKRLIVVAPTGVAAINAKGVTIHSFFQMPFGPILPDGSSFQKSGSSFQRKFSKVKINIIKSLDILIIDEISMVRSDLLDGIDQVLRRYRDRNKVFGGVQVLMIGDLQQLAPVVKDDEWYLLKSYYETPFFFSSKAFLACNAINIDLKHIYRQDNEKFINILNEIRNDSLSEASIKELNKRYLPNFIPNVEDEFITLTTHNNRAKAINLTELNTLDNNSQIYEAQIDGVFNEKSFPTHEKLELKVDAQVMFVKNDSSIDKRYYNGKIGKIIALNRNEVIVQCPNDRDEIIVTKETWENVNYTLNGETKEISESIIGSFSQIPLRLAWAITIHKSQGLTFEKAIIDANAAFAHGQTYVALSRCRTLEGVVLKNKINSESIINDLRVTSFNDIVSDNQPDINVLTESKKSFQLNLVTDLLNFYHFLYPLNRLIDIYYKNKNSFEGNIISPLTELKEIGIQPLLKVANNFKIQLLALSEGIDIPEENPISKERIQKAIAYFTAQAIKKIVAPLESLTYSTEDKALHKEFEKNMNLLEEYVSIKLYCLKGLTNDFSTKKYLKLRTDAVLQQIEQPKKRKEFVAETKHPILFESLKNLRNIIANAEDVPHFQIFTQRTLYELCNLLPLNKSQLKTIHGMGKIRIEKYGREILDFINDYADENNIEVNEILVKEKKENTRKVSLTMFKDGMSIPDIATKRDLVYATIEGHLASFIPSGEIDVYDLISKDKIQEIENKIKNLKFEGLSDLRAKLNDKYSYSELKYALNTIKNDSM